METAVQLGIGYDPALQVKGKTWEAVIFPTSESGFKARNTDSTSEDRFLRFGKTGDDDYGIFNLNALCQTEQPVFVVEGEIDCASITEVGGMAVGLGGIAMINSFMRYVAEHPPLVPLILALDNDEPGQEAQRKLAAGLNELSIPFIECDVAMGEKDANNCQKAHRCFQSPHLPQRNPGIQTS